MTPIFCCGFDCGQIAAISSDVGQHWTTSTGTGISISTSTVRSGARSLRINPSAAQGGAIRHTLLASSTTWVMNFWVRFATLPSISVSLAKFGTTNGPAVWFNQSDSTIYAAVGSLSAPTLGASGVAVTTGVWYCIDAHFNVVVGGNDTCDVRVDGTACGQATAVGDNAGLTAIVLGCLTAGATNHTSDVFFDDLVISQTAGDYPIGPGSVNHFVPNADGNHNVAGTNDFERGDTGTDINNTTTTAFQLVDDVPLPGGSVDAADNILLIAPLNATDYVECIFGPASGISEPTVAPRAVEVILVHHQAATGVGNIRVALNDNGTLDDILNLTAAGVVTYRYARKHYADPPSAASAWVIGGGPGTDGDFLGLKMRVFSSDANPDQNLDAIMVEAWFEEAAPAAPASFVVPTLNRPRIITRRKVM